MNMMKHDETWWVSLNILWTTINNDEDVLGSKTADFETVATCVDTEVDWERIGGAAWDQRHNTAHNCARNCVQTAYWICCSSWFVLKTTLRQSEQEHWRKHDIFSHVAIQCNTDRPTKVYKSDTFHHTMKNAFAEAFGVPNRRPKWCCITITLHKLFSFHAGGLEWTRRSSSCRVWNGGHCNALGNKL